MKNRFSLLIAVVALSFSVGGPWLSAAPAGKKAQIEKVIASPNDKISLAFSLTDGTPAYAVNFKKRPAILSSALGFQLKDGAMKTGFTLLDARKSSKDQTWTQPSGGQRQIQNHYNELAVSLQQAGDQERNLRIILRMFYDAIAFRYEWPEQPSLK